MIVTRDIARDLLPIYLAGEASADTRRVMESLMADDPVFAREVAAASRVDLALPETPAPPQSAEKQALESAKLRLKHRTSTLVMAVFFTLAPFMFMFDGSGITFVLWRDKPVVALAWWFTAAVLWGWHFWIRSRTRVLGL